MKVSVTQLRKLLLPGTEFKSYYVGPSLHIPGVEPRPGERKVIKNSSYQLHSEYSKKDGFKGSIFLTWSNLTIDQRDGAYFLSDSEGEFCKFVIK